MNHQNTNASLHTKPEGYGQISMFWSGSLSVEWFSCLNKNFKLDSIRPIWNTGNLKTKRAKDHSDLRAEQMIKLDILYSGNFLPFFRIQNTFAFVSLKRKEKNCLTMASGWTTHTVFKRIFQFVGLEFYVAFSNWNVDNNRLHIRCLSPHHCELPMPALKFQCEFRCEVDSGNDESNIKRDVLNMNVYLHSKIHYLVWESLVLRISFIYRLMFPSLTYKK